MRLLLDGSFGRSVCDALTGLGHDVESADLLSAAHSDDALVARGAETSRALLTLDEHFANPLRFDPSRTAGIIVISLPDQRSSEIAGPTERIRELSLEMSRSAADLERELDQLEHEIRATDDEAAPLKESASEAVAAGVTEGAANIEAALRAVEARRASLAASRDAVRAARDQAEGMVQRLTSRYYEVLVTSVTNRAAQLLEQSAGNRELSDQPQSDEVRPDRVAIARTVARGAAVEERTRFESDPGYRAARTEAMLRAKLMPIWGSIARDLARALTRLLGVADTRDPAGKLWLADVDDVRELHQSRHV